MSVRGARVADHLKKKTCITTKTMTVHELEPSELTSKLSNGGAVVTFYAPWCSHCQSFHEPFEKLAASNPGTKFFRFDMDKHRGGLSQKYEKLSAAVSSYPTVLGFKKEKDGTMNAYEVASQGRDPASMKTLIDHV